MMLTLDWLMVSIIIVAIVFIGFLIFKLINNGKDDEVYEQLRQMQQDLTNAKAQFLQEKLKMSDEFHKQLEQKIVQITNLEQQIVQLNHQHRLNTEKAIITAQKRSANTQRNVIKGQMAERFAPFMSGFEYYPADCRFLGEPIDYVIFHNVHACADDAVDLSEVAIVFLEIKTGSAKLNKRQEIIKRAIMNGQIKFETLRINNDNPVVYKDNHNSTPSSHCYDQTQDDLRVGQKWTEEEDERLVEAFDKGLEIKELAQLHGRKYGGIRSRLKKLGKIE
ncbi:Holliday junction resolvase-like protein [Moraxella canis]|uniref:Holliday junction resolvase-like protein n=1 Tax=Moraxella canis TaxID=90239 RepID=A0ABZ0X034_9GAMM|nr:Holliday junction resolvase-like protein [Moraxella canis]WQE04879.1 Holliday junction resolvase-like protein [Moraxella canis]